MSTPQDDQKSAMKQWFKRNCSWVLCQASLIQDVPDALPMTDVPSASVSRPLPFSLAQAGGPSCVDTNQPSTVPGPRDIGEHVVIFRVSIDINPVHRS